MPTTLATTPSSMPNHNQAPQNGSRPTSLSDVWSELDKLYGWEKPQEFSSIGDVDFDEASNWTITYKIIRRSLVLMTIIALHIAVVSGFMLIAYEWWHQEEGSSLGVVVVVAATMALLHQFFYGLSSAHSNDINNGRWFAVDTVRRAFMAAIGLLPFSLLPGFAIGGIFRKRIPLRMMFDRNGELLFIGRYIHYMMCFVLAQQSNKSFHERMLDAARLSVERRRDVFDVLEGERKRYYGSLALVAIAAYAHQSWLVPVIASINIFISHVGMIWMPTIAAYYAKHGGEPEKLRGGTQAIVWKALFSATGAIQAVVGISLVVLISHLAINTNTKKSISMEEHRRTLVLLPKPSDEMIGRWKSSATKAFSIDRTPEFQCSDSRSGYECRRVNNLNGACYNMREDTKDSLTTICLHDSPLDEKMLAESDGGEKILSLLKESGISISDIEFSLLAVNSFMYELNEQTLPPEPFGILRLREGSGSYTRYGRNVMISYAGVDVLSRVP
jgi:hypothetical protein